MVSGTDIAPGTYIASITNATTFVLSQNVLTGGVASGASLTLGSRANFAGNLTISGGTMKAVATASGANKFSTRTARA